MSDTLAAEEMTGRRHARGMTKKRMLVVGLVSLGVIAAIGVAVSRLSNASDVPGPAAPQAAESKTPVAAKATTTPGVIDLTEAQQKAVGLKTLKVRSEPSVRVLLAPGRVAPNELRYAHITPRAPGVVRSVLANIGQNVKAGDLLATIDSAQVGEARLELYTRLQTQEIARSQAEWQATTYKNTMELLDRLRKEETPEAIHLAFANKAVGENREKLMTAYAQFRLHTAKIERNRELAQQNLITTRQWEEVVAEFDAARSTYQSLMDQMGYEVKLANTRSQQALRQAETSVRAAREHLRILGVRPDGTEPEIEGGKVVGVTAEGTKGDAAKPDSPEAILPSETASPNATATGLTLRSSPVSTYSIWAPFDGTILDREMLVTGVAVDTTHRIFTLADLSSVWVEANVHENDFPELTRSGGGKIRFRSPAYPGREFDGSVTYTGDLVDEKTRAIKLLAKADNPDRLLKPGMFVEVEIIRPGEGSVVTVPTSSLLTEGSRTFLFVRNGAERFQKRQVEADSPRGDSVAIRKGLVDGEEIVVEGGSKLKSLAIQIASARE